MCVRGGVLYTEQYVYIHISLLTSDPVFFSSHKYELKCNFYLPEKHQLVLQPWFLSAACKTLYIQIEVERINIPVGKLYTILLYVL